MKPITHHGVAHYYVTKDRFGYTVVGLNSRRQVVNAINGGVGDSLKSVVKAAHRHWPGAKVQRRKKRRTAHRRSR